MKKDLLKWSGLPESLVSELVDRKHDQLEYKLFHTLNFKSKETSHWYYRTSALYAFQLACHPMWPVLDHIEKSPVLDYGGGLGNNFFPLLEKGFHVDYFDISYPCIDFIKWKLKNKGFDDFEYNIIEPYYGSDFDPIACFQKKRYNAIIFQSVLEHIHNYEDVLIKAISCLNYEGLLFIEAPFGGDDESYHLKEKKPITQILSENGIVNVSRDVWRKK